MEDKVADVPEKKAFSRQQPRPLRAGDRVYLRNLKTEGVVLDINREDIEVQIGKMRVKVDLRNIERARKKTPEKNTGTKAEKKKAAGHAGETSGTTQVAYRPSPGVELNLIGMRADDAMDKLDDYLDEAYAAGLPYARIVHGKGTGTLRQIVRQMLGASSLVSRWENAMSNEGGEGVTIAHFKEN